MVKITFLGNKNQKIRIGNVELIYDKAVEFPDGIKLPDYILNSPEFKIEGKVEKVKEIPPVKKAQKVAEARVGNLRINGEKPENSNIINLEEKRK